MVVFEWIDMRLFLFSWMDFQHFQNVLFFKKKNYFKRCKKDQERLEHRAKHTKNISKKI